MVLDELNRDPLKGEKPVFISFDTNAFIRRHYTLISNLLISNKRRAGFVASRGVLAELGGIDAKYQAPDISQISTTLGVNREKANLEILNEFFNQLKRSERLFRMGFVEYRKMSKREYFEELEGEKGDTNIIEKLEEFSIRKNVDLLVFSEDEAFIDRATAHKLMGIRLDHPEKPPPSTEVDWEETAQLLYTAAIIYGIISVTGKINARIHGIWRGKKAEHWNTETLKITTENPELQEFLEKTKKYWKTKHQKQEASSPRALSLRNKNEQNFSIGLA